MPTILLKPGREKSLLRRHPWVFSGAVARMAGNPTLGATIDVLAADGQFLARAAYSPNSQIRARVWTFDEHESVGAELFKHRIDRAISTRKALFPDSETTSSALRLIHAESDGLPGLIVDRYADVLVLQSLCAGMEFWKEVIADLLLETTGLLTIYERSDADVRTLEGLPPIVGILRGTLPASRIQIIENELNFSVELETGHKTGFYLDQRLNHRLVRDLAKGRNVLDCFCYSGGFALNAIVGGAESVLAVDASSEALELCKENMLLNHLPADRLTTLQGDVFLLLRKFRDEGRSFDLIILDPPKFAPTAAQADKAARGYKDINLLAFKLLRPGGLLVTFSCSGGIDATLFQKIIASAALDAVAEVQIVGHLSQSPDHPVALNFPESAYLKGLICRKG